ncbi:enoyl-CoA hydratase/isomerase family protein [Trinickia sp. Y13]|uniref:enoyl-CoA hydratase/isomerase family protein n=1 Tax=Trinickia sp. Y13 TaxID=2917807 RepID=UPI002406B2BF|nr:enoyl-CoA hydratase/isomerase family protein [Trinickia sp. Y13]MDG0025787.1 enoyl-CoA hydratase/isomerase family protein [Trinickia sp. Y13]
MNARVEPSQAARDGASGAPAEGRVLCHVVNGVAILTLDRPHALNALSHAMLHELAAHIERCRNDERIVALVLRGSGEKGLCAGGDVRALCHAANAGRIDGAQGWRPFFIDEYRLDFALHAFPKPIVALADGITMGGGMGLAQAAALRVATERSKIAMPETRIGFVPDVGATRFLSVMPVELSLYVGLTGAVLSGADAVYCGLADVCVRSDWLSGFEERLARLPSNQVLERLREAFVPPASPMPPATIEGFAPAIEKHFSARLTVNEMAASLASALISNPSTEMRAWLQGALDAMHGYSPTMLHVTREAILRGREITLADAYRMELGIVSRAIEEGDFREGVRAHLVDKDRAPRWQPSSLGGVGPERVAHFLNSPWASETHPLADLGMLPPQRSSRLPS